MMSDKKTIFYLVTQSETGGAQQYIFDLAASLKNEFNIIVAFGEQGEKGELAASLQAEKIKFHIIKHLKRNISPINDFLAFFEITKLIKKIQPDIIHLNSSKISILGSLAGRLYKSKIKNQKSKIVYTVHGWVFNEPLPKWKKAFYFYAEKFTARFKDAIICISKLDLEIASSKLKIPASKLALIHHGIKEIKIFPKSEIQQKFLNLQKSEIRPETGCRVPDIRFRKMPKAEAQQNLQPFFNTTEYRQPNTDNRIPTTEYRIISIGNLYKTKNYETFIKAVYILINSHKLPVTGIVIGEGGEREHLENLIGQLNLKNNFMLAGKINNAAELLPAFDVFVLSSIKEGLPYVVMEAMRAGLPIVATNVGGIPELIEDRKTGLLVEPNNAQILAKNIYYLLSNPENAMRMGEDAKKRVKEKFSMNTMILRIKSVYTL